MRLLVLTDLSGMLEPCGCSPRALGGLDRLVHAVQRARAEVPHSLLLVAGDTLFDASSWANASELPQQELWEAETLIDVLGELGASGVLLSEHDLRLDAARISALLRRVRFPLLGSTTTGVTGLTARAEHALGGLRVRLEAAATAPAAVPEGPGRDATDDTAPPAGGAAGNVRRVLLASVPRTQLDTRQAADDAALLILGGEPREQAEGAIALPHGTGLHAGRQGEQLLVADVWWPSPSAGFRRGRPPDASAAAHNYLDAHLLPITRDTPSHPGVRARLEALASQINAYNAASARRPATAPRAPRRFAGSAQCAACHTAAFLWWQSSAHGHAFASLQQRHKEYNLDCVPCHVTGYGLGGASLSELDGLSDVGCESCHEAALRHVEDPRHGPRPPRVPQPDACRHCHDSEHSPDFDLARYGARLRGPGHAAAGVAR